MEEKREIKKGISRLGWGLIIYSLINYGIVFADMIWQVVRVMMQTTDPVLQDQQIAAMAESAVSMIIGVSVGVLLLWLYMGKEVSGKEMFDSRKVMTAKEFFLLLSIFMTAQLVVSLLSQVMETALNLIGFSAMESIESASSTSETISMFLYASFVAPIVEELVYRGFVLGYLRRYGKMFAIIVSSILFGLMHANVVQIVFAFFVGLVLAYITEEYSIKWAILIHIINNFVFAELTGIAGKIVGETFEILLTNSFVVGFFVVGVLTLWKNREAIAEYLDKNREPAEKYIYAFTTVPLAIFTIVNLLLALAAIQPLGS